MLKKKKKQGLGVDLSLEYYHQQVDLKKIVRELYDFGVLTDEMKKHLLTSVNIRNKHIHFSFMDIDSFDKELSESFYYLFREIDKLVQKYKVNFL